MKKGVNKSRAKLELIWGETREAVNMRIIQSAYKPSLILDKSFRRACQNKTQFSTTFPYIFKAKILSRICAFALSKATTKQFRRLLKALKHVNRPEARSAICKQILSQPHATLLYATTESRPFSGGICEENAAINGRFSMPQTSQKHAFAYSAMTMYKQCITTMACLCPTSVWLQNGYRGVRKSGGD